MAGDPVSNIAHEGSETAAYAIPEDATARVGHDAAWVAAQSNHVHVDSDAVIRSANGLQISEARRIFKHEWDEDLHLGVASAGDAVMVQYLLVVDAINFCFWPQPGLEYEHLARGIKESVQENESCLDASWLMAADGPAVQRLLRRSQPLPLQEERAALLREIGGGLQRHWGGQAVQMVAAAKGSAAALVRSVLQSFPGFRDCTLYRGRDVWLLKRAQIFVGDVWGAFGGRGCGAFHDVGCLTAFADYRVPVVLRKMGILQYSPHLARLVDSQTPLAAGSEEEIELRACTIVAVEEIRKALQDKFEASTEGGISKSNPKSADYVVADASNGSETLPAEPLHLNSVAIDWWLWEAGEAHRTGPDAHHRTITTFY